MGKRTDIRDMFKPVRCAHCGSVYDVGKVEVTARYTDCSVWNAPCCGRTVDDRGETGWKSHGDYTVIDKSTTAYDDHDVFGIRPSWRRW